MTPYGNSEALKIARDLDAKVETLLTAAASEKQVQRLGSERSAA